MNPNIIIGQNIKLFREQKGVKQEILAKHLGITKGRMSQIEKGDCVELSVKRINKIADILEVSFFEITSMTSENIHLEKNLCSINLYPPHLQFIYRIN